MLDKILAKKKAALAAKQAGLFPLAMFIHLALKYNWHKRDPVRDLELIADWLGPDFNTGEVKPVDVPSLLNNWQILSLANMTYQSEEMVYAHILQELPRVTHISCNGYVRTNHTRRITTNLSEPQPDEIFDF